MSMRVHVLGVGKMGLPIASHLAAAGHAVTVSDPSAERRALASAQHLAVVEEAERAIAAAEVVLSSLPHDAALREVAAQVAGAARPGTIYADTSTVSPGVSAEVAGRLSSCGVSYLRCTVSGNNKMAEMGQLTVMASGPRTAYETTLPLLRTFGTNHFYLGEAEQARLMKLVVNLMIAQTSAMLAEALTLGRKGGLDWQTMWQVLGASAVASPIVKAKGVQLGVRDFTPTFTVEQMIKDLDLILCEGEASRVPLLQTAMTHKLMCAAVDQGNGQDDYAAIIKVLERGAGLRDPL